MQEVTENIAKSVIAFVQESKRSTETNIRRAVQQEIDAFEKQTGMSINEIRIDFTTGRTVGGGRITLITEVNCRLEDL